MAEDKNLFTFWDEVIVEVAKDISRDFPDVDYDDVYQQLWMFVVEHGEKFEDAESLEGLLWTVADQFAWKIRAQHLTLSAQYCYRYSDLKRILETAFHYNEWESTFVPDDARSMVGSDSIDLASDVTWAMEKLRRRNRGYYDAILKRFRDKIVPHNASAERKKLDRAVNTLADILNTYNRLHGKDYVGTRKAISNNTAQHIIKNEWED